MFGSFWNFALLRLLLLKALLIAHATFFDNSYEMNLWAGDY